MLMVGTPEPLAIYQCNPEWGSQPHVLMEPARDITLYDLKEAGRRSIVVRDCGRIKVFDFGGITNALEGKAFMEVERTPNFRRAGLVDRMAQKPLPGAGPFAAPSTWHMLSELPPDGRPAIRFVRPARPLPPQLPVKDGPPQQSNPAGESGPRAAEQGWPASRAPGIALTSLWRGSPTTAAA